MFSIIFNTPINSCISVALFSKIVLSKFYIGYNFWHHNSVGMLITNAFN